MDTLDSRSLRYIDCFAQHFTTPGKVIYRITTLAGACLPVEERGEFTIEVKAQTEKGGEGQQHNVQVLKKGDKFVAEPAHLEIRAGDMVLWNTPDPGISGYAVVGRGPGGSFNSTALTSEALYTHAFGTPGEYKWVDANNGKVSGVIIVRSMDSKNQEECAVWTDALSKGSVIIIEGDNARPRKLEILTGQTVFWAVQKAPGISITDARLIMKG